MGDFLQSLEKGSETEKADVRGKMLGNVAEAWAPRSWVCELVPQSSKVSVWGLSHVDRTGHCSSHGCCAPSRELC